jgi:hypothetical protein
VVIMSCPFCRSEVRIDTRFGHLGFSRIHCPACVQYDISDAVIAALPDSPGWGDYSQAQVSEACRRAAKDGCPIKLMSISDVLIVIRNQDLASDATGRA